MVYLDVTLSEGEEPCYRSHWTKHWSCTLSQYQGEALGCPRPTFSVWFSLQLSAKYVHASMRNGAAPPLLANISLPTDVGFHCFSWTATQLRNPITTPVDKGKIPLPFRTLSATGQFHEGKTAHACHSLYFDILTVISHARTRLGYMEMQSTIPSSQQEGGLKLRQAV